ncbi:MAG: hypothetical protein VB853_02870 [Pirellulales bacterium]
MNTLINNSICFLALVALADGPLSARAAVTSENHPVLERTLRQHPEADGDGDGVLTFAEHRQFVEKQGPRKQADGRPAGPISTVLENGDVVVANFEENNFGRMREWGWTVEGKAFSRDLNTGTAVMKRRAGDFRGKYLLTSYVVSDADEGQLSSPIFDIELNRIEIVMSGGEYPHRVCVNLIVDDQVVRTATGRNDDLLDYVAFDVAALKGRQARIQVVDAHRRVWGHINVDRIYQTNNSRAKRVIAAPPIGFGKAIGRVRTNAGDLRRGPLLANDGKLRVDNHDVELPELLLAVCESESQLAAGGSAVRLINGETWQGKLLGLVKGVVSIESPLLGKRDVPVSQIACLDFVPVASSEGEPGTLYRTQGEPIPGKLIYIRDKNIAIDCPLGIVPIPRSSVRRFVMAAVDPKAGGTEDEMGLTDGSLFRGRLAFANDNLVLTHPTLGSLMFQWDAVRYVRRTPPGVTWLDRLEPSGLQRVGPVLPPSPPAVINAGNRGHLRAVRMLPHTVVRYPLSATATGGRVFRAQVAAVVGCRADVSVRILAGDREVWKRQIGPNSEPLAVSADLSGATEMTIEVNFGEHLAFPCGVNWLDAHVVAK